ncbi:hypothetical protein QBE53_10890 [Vallitaleaceae bacterium 9-2]
MNKYLILISVSGIQEYIMQSIKTADLFKNSQAVTRQMKSYIDFIEAQSNTKSIIIPQNKGTQIPNYCLFEYYSDKNQFELALFFEKKPKNDNVDLETYISIYPWTDIEVTYDRAYEAVYERLELLKADRAYSLMHDAHQEANITIVTGKKICMKCKKRPVDGQETLCSYCEHASNDNHPFPSTTDIAAWNTLRNMSEANFQEVSASKEKSQERITNELYKKGIITTPYYGIIQLDVDDFGKHMAGAYLEEGSDLKQHQIMLTKQVQEMNKSIESIVKKREEEVKKRFDAISLCNKLRIYIGGDDALFFCPVQYIEKVLTEIREEQDKLNNLLQKEGYKKLVTLSVAVVMTHHETDFRSAIKLSRHQLEATKHKYRYKGKNGLSLTLKQRSGALYTSYLPYTLAALSTLDALSARKDKEAISLSKIPQLEYQLRLLGNTFEIHTQEVAFKNIINNEIKRISQERTSSISVISYTNLKTMLDFFKEYEYSHLYIDWDGFFSLFKVIECIHREEVKSNEE